MCRFLVRILRPPHVNMLTFPGLQRLGRDLALEADPRSIALYPHTVIRLAAAA
jgi:hypothetical protein